MNWSQRTLRKKAFHLYFQLYSCETFSDLSQQEVFLFNLTSCCHNSQMPSVIYHLPIPWRPSRLVFPSVAAFGILISYTSCCCCFIPATLRTIIVVFIVYRQYRRALSSPLIICSLLFEVFVLSFVQSFPYVHAFNIRCLFFSIICSWSVRVTAPPRRWSGWQWRSVLSRKPRQPSNVDHP